MLIKLNCKQMKSVKGGKEIEKRIFYPDGHVLIIYTDGTFEYQWE